VSSPIIEILRNLGPNVEDVCLKYGYIGGGLGLEKLRVVIEEIQHFESPLKYFSFLIRYPSSTASQFFDADNRDVPRITGLTQLEKEILNSIAKDFSLAFRLKGCFIQVDGEEIVSEGDLDEEKFVVEDWMRLLDNKYI
jgi:hypothetical protein